MSHREIDYLSVLMMAEEKIKRLNEEKARKFDELTLPYKNRKYFKPKQESELIKYLENDDDWIIFSRVNHNKINRAKQLKSLAKCGGALNRMVYLDTSDCYFLYGENGDGL